MSGEAGTPPSGMSVLASAQAVQQLEEQVDGRPARRRRSPGCAISRRAGAAEIIHNPRPRHGTPTAGQSHRAVPPGSVDPAARLGAPYNSSTSKYLTLSCSVDCTRASSTLNPSFLIASPTLRR